MADTGTKTPRGTATLLGIYKGEGHACDDCNRDLTARRFEVRTATGEVRILGRKCAAYATGYPTTRLEHEAKRAAEYVDWCREVATTWTVDQFADHYREVLVTYPDDTVDTWLPATEGETARTVRRPVTEIATEQMAILRAEYVD